MTRPSPAAPVSPLPPWFAVVVCLCGSWTPAANGQAPTLSRTSPQAIAPGGTVDVTCHGANLAGATELWTTFGERAALASDLEHNGEDPARVVFRVRAPASAPLGVHGVRVTTPGGAGNLRLFVVDDLRTVAEAGGNNSRKTPQPLTLPCAVDGTVKNLSRDYFQFDVAAGQRVSFEVLARRLGSPLDPSLYLYRADGRELLYNDDAEGLSSDCQFVHTFADAGSYLLEVRDIQYAGSAEHVYRLRIGDFPCVNVALPQGVQRGRTAEVHFAGISVEDAAPATIAIPFDAAEDWRAVSTQRPDGNSSAFASVRISSGEEVLEQEPNNALDQANSVTLGAGLNGRLDQAADVDYFAFDARAGQRFDFSGVTRQSGAPTDLILRLYGPDGAQVAMVDDNGTGEGVLSYAFPSDGRYSLGVHDLNHRGGSQFGYRVAVTPFQAGFSLTASTDVINVPAGGVAAVTVNAARREYHGPIDVALTGLPPGLTSLPTRIGPGRALAVLTVQATQDAPRGALAPVRVVGSARIGDQDVRDVASVEAVLRAQWSNTLLVPGPMRESLVVAVAPPPPLALRIEPREVTFGRELSASVKVTAERGEGLDEAITLAITPVEGGVPPNVAVALKPIDKGNEVELVFTGAEAAPLGVFTVVLVGTHTKDNVSATAFTPGIGLVLAPPFQLQPRIEASQLSRGGELKFKVAIVRNPAFTGDVGLTFDKLPAGVTAAAATIAGDQTETEVTLIAAADAAAITTTEIVVKGASAANPKLTATAAIPRIEVE